MKILYWVGYFLLILLLIVAFVYDTVDGRVRTKEVFELDKYLEDPQYYNEPKYEGMVKIINISEDHFYINLNNRIVRVAGSGIERPKYGETIVYLHYTYEGIELINFHNYNYNYVLYGVSIIALIIFVIIFFMEWKITLRGFKSA